MVGETVHRDARRAISAAAGYLTVAREVAADIIAGVLRIHRDNPGLDLPEDWQVSFLLAQRMRGLLGAAEQFDRDPDVFRPAVEVLWDALIAAGACESRPVYFDGTPSDDEGDRAEFMDDMFLSFTEAFVQVKQPGGGLAAAFHRGQAQPITLLPPIPRFGRCFTGVMSAAYHVQRATRGGGEHRAQRQAARSAGATRPEPHLALPERGEASQAPHRGG